MPSQSLTSAANLALSQLSTLHGELEAGRNPQWYLQDDADQLLAPVTAADGISLVNGSDGGAIQALINIGVRHVAAYRTIIVRIDTLSNSTQYDLGVSVGGGGTHTASYTSSGSATWKADLEGSGISGQILVYSEEDPHSGEYRLRITGNQSDPTQGLLDIAVTGWQHGASVDGSEIEVEGDPTYIEVCFWALPGGAEAPNEDDGMHQYIPFIGGAYGSEESSAWRRITPVTKPGTTPVLDFDGLSYVPYGGYQERLDVRGLSRIHIQVVHSHGPSADNANVTLRSPFILVGPAFRESRRQYGT